MLIGVGIGLFNQNFKKSNMLVYDSFNRTDNTTTLGKADSGQTWETWSGTWGIASNQAYISSGTSNSKVAIESGSSDCVITLKNSLQSAGNRILFRGVETNNHYQFQTESSQFRIYKNEGGVSTMLGSNSTIIPSSGDILKVVLSGSSIKCFVNDNLVFDISNTFNQTSTKHGMMLNNSVGRLDDFKVEAL